MRRARFMRRCHGARRLPCITLHPLCDAPVSTWDPHSLALSLFQPRSRRGDSNNIIITIASAGRVHHLRSSVSRSSLIEMESRLKRESGSGDLRAFCGEGTSLWRRALRGPFLFFEPTCHRVLFGCFARERKRAKHSALAAEMSIARYLCTGNMCEMRGQSRGKRKKSSGRETLSSASRSCIINAIHITCETHFGEGSSEKTRDTRRIPFASISIAPESPSSRKLFSNTGLVRAILLH